MCSIFIVNKPSFDAYNSDWTEHLRHEAELNNNGFAALFLCRDRKHSLIRSMVWQDIEDMMALKDWETVIIHQRYTTQGASIIGNTHMWQVGNKFYCHNGILRDPECAEKDVDSQMIGDYLYDGIFHALEYCQSEPYANVFIVDGDTNHIYVSRSSGGTLYTDDVGQYSSTPLTGICDIPVLSYTTRTHRIHLPMTPVRAYNTKANMFYASTNSTTPPKVPALPATMPSHYVDDYLDIDDTYVDPYGYSDDDNIMSDLKPALR